MFHLTLEKEDKFLNLIREFLNAKTITIKTLQRLVGKCVSFSLVVPGARLFTKEMNAAISKGHLSSKLIQVCWALREKISHWLFLETWDDPLLWRDERHVRVSVATDASNFA